jgi:hypothetical protein
MDDAPKGTVTIDDGYSKPIKRDLSKVIVIGADQDTPREVLAMGETHRMLSSLSPAEAYRVATWLAAKFPQPPF